MSQSGVTFEEVRITAERLAARGERPTISRVKEELAGRGSSVTIGAFLRQWRGDDAQPSQGGDFLSVEHVTLSAPSAPASIHHESAPAFKEAPAEKPIHTPVQFDHPSHGHSHSTEPTHAQKGSESEGSGASEHSQERRPEGDNRGGNNDRGPRERRGHFDRHHKQRGSGDRQQFREQRGGEQRAERGERGEQRSDRGQHRNQNAQHGGQNNYSQNGGQPHHTSQGQGGAPQFSDDFNDRESEKAPVAPISYWAQYDYVFHGDLGEKSDRELEILIRRMESLLAKEQSRRETAEKLFEETKEYSSAIRKQVADRINDMKLTHDTVVANLKVEARELKLAAEKDLMYYRDQLGRANQKIMELIKGGSAGAPEKEDHPDSTE